MSISVPGYWVSYPPPPRGGRINLSPTLNLFKCPCSSFNLACRNPGVALVNWSYSLHPSTDSSKLPMELSKRYKRPLLTPDKVRKSWPVERCKDQFLFIRSSHKEDGMRKEKEIRQDWPLASMDPAQAFCTALRHAPMVDTLNGLVVEAEVWTFMRSARPGSTLGLHSHVADIRFWICPRASWTLTSTISSESNKLNQIR